MAKQKQLDNLGVSAFCESMGMMVRAGIQTDEAVALLDEIEVDEDLILNNSEVKFRRFIGIPTD